MRKPTLISLDNVGPDTPLRLSVAAALAFPDGSISENSLRREAKRGRLTVEVISGKAFVTLNEISRMRDQCRVIAKDQDFIAAEPVSETDVSSRRRSGSSVTANAVTPQDALRARLKRNRRSRL